MSSSSAPAGANMRWRWRSQKAPCSATLFVAPGNPGTAEIATNVALDAATRRSYRLLPGASRSASSSSAPSCRWSPVSSMRSRRRASRPSGRAGSGAARRLEGFHQGSAPDFAIPTGGYARFADAAAARLCAGKGRADRRQGRRPRRRQGRRRCGHSQRGGGGDRHDLRRRLRGGGRRSGDRRVARRRGSLVFRSCATAECAAPSPPRRTTSASATATAGRIPAAWAPIRRAPVMTRAERARDARRSSGRRSPAMQARATPFKGILFAGLMIGADGPAAHRIQRPLRRSRNPGDPAAARRRSARPAARRGRRPAAASVCVFPGDSLDRRARGARLSRKAPQGRTRSRPSTRAEKIPGVSVIHAGTRMRRRPARRRWRPRAQCRRSRRQRRGRPGPRLSRRRRHSTSPDGFCRRDIGWRAIRR